LIEIINKQLLLQLVGYLCYWQMGFNSVFKGLNDIKYRYHFNVWLVLQSVTVWYMFNRAQLNCCVRPSTIGTWLF